MKKWQDAWEKHSNNWTKTLIPDIEIWIKRKHGGTRFHLTQAISGHGCFAHFLKRIGKLDTGCCWYCGKEDLPEHTLFGCPKFEEERRWAEAKLKEKLKKENLIPLMVRSEQNWENIVNLITQILKYKEEDERKTQTRNISKDI